MEEEIFFNDIIACEEVVGPDNEDSYCVPVAEQEYVCPDIFDDADDSQLLVVEYTPDTWTSYPFTCKHCRLQEFYTFDSIREHSKDRHGTCMGLQCADCNEETSTFDEFVRHARTHREDLKHCCELCNLQFDGTHQIGDHKSDSYCEFCGEMDPDISTNEHQPNPFSVTELEEIGVRTLETLQYRAENIICWEDYPWLCYFCNTKFIDQWSLRDHLKFVHEKCFGMKCLDCVLTQKTFEQFVAHVREHRPLLKEKCEYCDLTVTDEVQYKLHLYTAHKLNYRCFKCSENFITEDDLYEHTSRYFESPIDMAYEYRISNMRKPKPIFCCDSCGTLYKTLSFLTEHKADNACGFTCDCCSFKFKSKSQLIRHIKAFSTRSCHICYRYFASVIRLQGHIRTHSVPMFGCVTCDSKFKTKADLRIHFICDHGCTTPYRCNYCDRAFECKLTWVSHESLHTGKKPYFCNVCNTYFDYARTYTKHIKEMHLSGKVVLDIDNVYKLKYPYVCRTCNINFGFPYYYKIHMQEKHGVVEEQTENPREIIRGRKKPYFCAPCNTDFAFADNYELHMSTVHNNNNNDKVLPQINCKGLNKKRKGRTVLAKAALKKYAVKVKKNIGSKKTNNNKKVNKRYLNRPKRTSKARITAPSNVNTSNEEASNDVDVMNLDPDSDNNNTAGFITPVEKVPPLLQVLKPQVPTAQAPKAQIAKESPEAQFLTPRILRSYGSKAQSPIAEAPKPEFLKAESLKHRILRSYGSKTQVPRVQVPKAQVPQAQIPKAKAPKAQVPKAQIPKSEDSTFQFLKPQVPKAKIPRAGLNQKVTPNMGAGLPVIPFIPIIPFIPVIPVILDTSFPNSNIVNSQVKAVPSEIGNMVVSMIDTDISVPQPQIIFPEVNNKAPMLGAEFFKTNTGDSFIDPRFLVTDTVMPVGNMTGFEQDAVNSNTDMEIYPMDTDHNEVSDVPQDTLTSIVDKVVSEMNTVFSEMDTNESLMDMDSTDTIPPTVELSPMNANPNNLASPVDLTPNKFNTASQIGTDLFNGDTGFPSQSSCVSTRDSKNAIIDKPRPITQLEKKAMAVNRNIVAAKDRASHLKKIVNKSKAKKDIYNKAAEHSTVNKLPTNATVASTADNVKSKNKTKPDEVVSKPNNNTMNKLYIVVPKSNVVLTKDGKLINIVNTGLSKLNISPISKKSEDNTVTETGVAVKDNNAGVINTSKAYRGAKKKNGTEEIDHEKDIDSKSATANDTAKIDLNIDEQDCNSNNISFTVKEVFPFGGLKFD